VTAVTPRDAASLLLYRKEANRVLVLMGRRPGKSRFMPDVYVFPGGRVDACDMAVGRSHARAQTIAMAAVRETYEETGLLVASAGNPGTVKDASWQLFGSRGCSADLSILTYLGRAITPASESIRFHARFFVCDIAAVQGR